jgi:hypothetical protein
MMIDIIENFADFSNEKQHKLPELPGQQPLECKVAKPIFDYKEYPVMSSVFEYITMDSKLD